MRRPAWRLFAAGLALLSGCSASLLPKPPPAPARHTLDGAVAAPATAPAPAAARPAVATAGLTLVVAPPRASPGFDSPRMVYLRRPLELEAFAFHEWVAPPAQMLAPLIARALQDGGGFRAVLLAPSSGSGDWRLETELVRLQQDFSTPPSQVRLTLRAALLDAATGRVIGVREFDASVPAPSDDPVSGVAAAHQATQRVLAALAAFCAGQVPAGGRPGTGPAATRP